MSWTAARSLASDMSLAPRGYIPVEDGAYCNASNAPQILGVTGAFMGLAVLAVILRMYVRIRMLKFVGADDWTMISAAVMAIGTFVCFVGETWWGMGRHNKCLSLPNLQMQIMWEFFHGILIITGVVLVKISIAFFLIRLAPRKAWKRFLWVAIAFLVCFNIACVCTIIFDCTPVDAAWDFALRAKPTTRCFSTSTFSFLGLFNSIVNICTDVLFAVIPIPIIIKLQVNTKTKVSLVLILSIGLVACAAGIVKANKQTTFIKEPDAYWTDDFNVWNMLELCLGIIAASLPSLKPLFASWFESTKTMLGFSDPGSKGKSNNAQPVRPQFHQSHTGHSSSHAGYKRQYDPHAVREVMDDVELDGYAKHPYTTTVEATVEASDAAYLGRGSFSQQQQKRPYKVPRVRSTTLSRSRGSVDEAPETFGRSDSQERLHYPAGIYKSIEVTSTSEVMRR